MKSLESQRVIVTGGSRGLGLGLVEALVAGKARVVVVARDAQLLAELERRLGVTTVIGDVTDPGLAASLLREFRPAVLALNAGATPVMGPLHEQTWEGFNNTWNTDVKAGFHWLQAALRLPLPSGSRVLISSSGAAIGGSPLSGGYAGAKRMLWFMANYANAVATELDLGIRFQALVPMQMLAAGGVGRAGAQGYARRKGVTPEALLANFGKSMSAREFGDYVVNILTDPQYQAAPALGLKGEFGVRPLEA
jgi:NAD(P)-dependent dehydrogenase (short-subunit alcohol dehydrogenase family)